jgi:hypothetical protein
LAKATKTKPPTSTVGRDLNLTKNFRSTYTPVARTHFWVAKIRERSYRRAAAAPAALRLISFKQCQLAQNSAQSTHFGPPGGLKRRPRGALRASYPIGAGCALREGRRFLQARMTQHVAVHHAEGK